MTLKVKGKPSHTGDERYEITLSYDEPDLATVRRITRVGQIVPATVVLVWVRRVGGEWRRYTNGVLGSRACGPEKLGEYDMGGPVKSREVFTRDLGELRPWVTYLPGLRPAIEDAEASLPR